MLEYTGHPLIDVGVATITAFVSKRDPTQLTEADLERVADYIAREYVQLPLKSSFTIAFTVNSGFFQPGFNKQPEKRQIYAERVLHSYHADVPILDERCVFTGKPAAAVSFDTKDKLSPGYAFRQHIPLLTGEGVINFCPSGVAGLPVSGIAMLALQAFPLGCAKCSGRLLAVHSDVDELTYYFAATFLQKNREAIQLARMAGSKKIPDTHLLHRTLLVDVLMELQIEARDESDRPFSLTAYHMSNSGQEPKLDIYYLPLEITGFLRDMQTAEYRDEWNAIVRRAWEVPPKKKGRRKKDEKPFQPRRNWLYEDLFDLPDNAARFLRTYFLRTALRYAKGKTDPRVNYSLQNEADLVSWKITARFLRRILHMDTERIEQIRRMGDRLAEYVNNQNDRYLFTNFRSQNYHHFRTTLLRANLAEVRRGNSPVVEFDPYIEVFEMAENDARPDWRLARDLVLIRMIERLYQLGWLGANIDAAPDVTEEESQ